MALPLLIITGGMVATRLALASPAVLASIGARFAVPGTVKAISAYAVKHPVIFATTAYAGYQAGDAAWTWIGESSELLDVIKQHTAAVSHTADPITPAGISDVMRYADELHMITAAVRSAGGMERLLNLRKVLALPDEYFVLHKQLQGINL